MSGDLGGGLRVAGLRAIAVALTLAAAAPIGATTLYDAIRLAYQTNPDLRGQRAEQRAVGEGYVQARANLGPQVNLNGQGGYSVARVESGPSLLQQRNETTYRGSSGQGNLSFVQPIFTFGAASSKVRGAKSAVMSGREALRQTEAEVLGKVIMAYVDVRQDRAVLGVLTDEIRNLSQEFIETRERGKAGQLTRTDVAEAQAKLLQTQSQLELARGRLMASEGRYLQAVGEAPGDLAPEPQLPGVPATIVEALEAADGNNPQVLGAVHDEVTAREKVNEAKAAYGPTISMRVDAGIQPTAPYVPDFYDRNVTVAGMVSLPIFTSGMRSSKVREAGYRDDEAALKIESVRRDIIQNVTQAWSQLVATTAAVEHAQQVVEVYKIAVEGNQIEQRVGRRSIFELLNTETELANARIELLQNGHDRYVAQAALLAAMGTLEAASITPGMQTYDPVRSTAQATRHATLPWEPVVQALDGALSQHSKAPSVSPARPGPAASPAAKPTQF